MGMKTIGILSLLWVFECSMAGWSQERTDTLRTDMPSTGIVDTDEVDADTVNSDLAGTGKAVPVAGANTRTYVNPVNARVRARFKAFLDRYRKEDQARTERWDDIFIPHAPAWIRPNGDYYKLAMPATYYSDAIEQAMSIEGWKPEMAWVKRNPVRDSVFQVPCLTHTADVDRAVNRQLLSFYLQYPGLVRRNERDLEEVDPLPEEMRVIGRARKDKLLSVLAPSPRHRMDKKDLLVVKPNFWTLSGNGYLQFSQNYVSDNWYKGGESSVSLLAGLVWQFNYDDKQRVQFENKIEWKLGFITAPSDTVHQTKTSEDMIRLSSKLGYQAVGNWYYTLSAEFKTQLFSMYDTNSDNMVSGLFSPAELNIGLGMDYKYSKENRCNLSVLLSPLNYTRYSVLSDRVDPTDFNIKEGHKVENQLGSRVESTLKWTIINDLVWESRFSYTTNYEKVLTEWENTFTFTFNKYISTKLFVHARFDDSVTLDDGDTYFQLQELLSLGFNYTW